ncbi:MAG TPA: tetratricopeptide repeat protein, partial [Planctomycetes bacterium]|nr:tetratricopeptide repeat protein [Planctomycetota bacterium]
RQQALLSYQRALEISPSYAPLVVRRGMILLAGGEIETARVAFAGAVEIDDTLIQAHLGLARCALATGDDAAAAGHLDRCQSLGPTSGEIASAQAVILRRKGDEEGAAALLESAASRRAKEPLPDPLRDTAIFSEGVGPQWWRERSRRLVAAGRAKEAMSVWIRALRDSPDDPELNYQMGFASEAAGEAGYAIVHYQKAIGVDPQMAKAFAGLGTAYSRQGEGDKAEAALRKALSLSPDLHLTRGNLGSLLVSTGREEEGMQYLEEVVKEVPDSSDAHFNLAMALKLLGDLKRATVHFGQAVAVSPSKMRGRFEYGIALAEGFRFEEAVAQFQVVVGDNPKRVAAQINLMRALGRCGRLEEARDTIRGAAEEQPGNPRLAGELYWFLSTCLQEDLRNGVEAEDIAAKLCKAGGDASPRYLDVWAAALAEIGDFDGAIERAEQALLLVEDSDGTSSARTEIELRLAGYRLGEPHRQEP